MALTARKQRQFIPTGRNLALLPQLPEQPRLHSVRLHDPDRLRLVESLAVERRQILAVERRVAPPSCNDSAPLREPKIHIPANSALNCVDKRLQILLERIEPK